MAALFRRSPVPSVPINWIVFKEKTVVGGKERISEIKLECLLKKLQINYFYMVFIFYEPYWIEEICDTPAEYLASQDPQPLAVRRLGRQSAERERISEICWNVFLKKLQRTMNCP
ncbi:hypothetical protein KEH51_27120 [[Brevibacterium] frigoritolerans]|uniref:Uncharacterized protein n=1 Tax=Peribacillus frigoritolerans TaxID=450367 RepID=A0A941JBY0_9BACI|nr:hypothetical protein [Peribacillus frigoritolerans]